MIEKQDIDELDGIYAKIAFLLEVYEKATYVENADELDAKKQLLKDARDQVLKSTFRAKQILERMENVRKP